MDIFIRKPVLSLVITLILVFSGLLAALKIPVLQFPQLNSASLLITTRFEGSSADVVQGFITEPIERAAMTVPGVDYVDSKTSAGLSLVTVWLEQGTDQTRALTELTSQLYQISYELPASAEDPGVTVQRADRSAAVFYLSVNSGNLQRAAVTDYLKRQVIPRLSAINGVQRIGLHGERDPAMRVWLDPERMAALNMGADQIWQALEANNVLATLGKTENRSQQINLLSNALLKTPDDFAQLVLRSEGHAVVRLGDIARVELGESTGSETTRIDKQQQVFIAVWPQPGANEIEIGDALYPMLADINKNLPQGVAIDIAYDGTTYMRQALQEIFITLLETVVVVGLVVMVLMGSLRTAIVPLVTIPLSILGAVAVIWAMGFSLNLLTILAIVLSVGLVVDDAIVVVENVARYIREGMSPMQAALVSSRELLQPIIAMTLTLAVVYIPIGFVSGLTGSLFREFSFTLAIAVTISGVVAMTLSPILSARINQGTRRDSRMTTVINNRFDGLQAAYGRLLDHVFVWRSQILLVALVIALLSVPFYLLSQKELAPAEDQNGVMLIVEAPAHASIDYTNRQMDTVVDALEDVSGREFIWQVLTPNAGFGGISLVDFEQRSRTDHEMLPEIYQTVKSIAGLNVLPVLQPALPTAGQFDIELVIQSADDYQTMEGYAYQLIEAAYHSGLFMFATTDLKMNLPQSRLVFDTDRIADLGLTMQGVSDQLKAMNAEQFVNRFDRDGKSYRVITLVDEKARTNADNLMDLTLVNPNGEWVPLSAIAHLQTEVSPKELGKFNQQRAFRILGGIIPGVTTDMALTALEQAAASILPANYQVDYAGISRQLRSEGNSLLSVLGAALVMVYLLLAVQFNSFRLPWIVLLGSVPLALSGALSFSFLSLTTINIYAQIGLVTLVALNARNAILIVEFARELQKQGLSRLEAIRQAAQTRLRAILITTLATVLGHLPLVLVTGAGAAARNSIGITLVGGMVIGTILLLLVLPCVYLLVARETDVHNASHEEDLVSI